MEPTEEMISAGNETYWEAVGHPRQWGELCKFTDTDAKDVYQSMLAAVPEPKDGTPRFKDTWEYLNKLAESYALKGENSEERAITTKLRQCAEDIRDADQTAIYYRDRTIELEQELAKLKEGSS